MTLMTHAVLVPDGVDDATKINVEVTIISDRDREGAPCYDGSDNLISGRWRPDVAADGSWELELPPTSEVSPANTVYRARTKVPGPAPLITLEWFTVPADVDEAAVSAYIVDPETDAGNEFPIGAHGNLTGRSGANAHPSSAVSHGTSTAEDAIDARDLTYQGRQHTPAAQAWLAAVADITTRPVRVLLIGDSMPELGAGFQTIWEEVRAVLGPTGSVTPASFWWPPGWFEGFFDWPVNTGTIRDVGVDKGARITAGQEAATTGGPQVCDSIDLILEAIGGAAQVDIEIDEATAESNVALPLGLTRWRSGPLALEGHTVGVAADSGTVDIYGAAHHVGTGAGGAGLYVVGIGRSGYSSADHAALGGYLKLVNLFLDEDEPFDLVVFCADTADAPSASATVATVTAMVTAIRSAHDTAGVARPSIAHWIAPNHNGRADWETTFVPAFRRMHRDLGLIPLDSSAALDDVSNPEDLFVYSDDGVHFTTKGYAANRDVWLDALLSRSPRAVAARVRELLTELEDLLDAHTGDTTAAHAASAVSVNATGLAIVNTTDVQAALGQLDGAVAARAALAGATFTGTVHLVENNQALRLYPTSLVGPLLAIDPTNAYSANPILAPVVLSQFGLAFGAAGVGLDTSILRSGTSRVRIADGTTAGGASLELVEVAVEPAAPPANMAILFLIDNGAGKSVAKVKFNTGAAQTVATQP